jgi:hypothetical protein
MGRAQQRYESCRELLHREDNWGGLPIRIGEVKISDPRHLSTILEARWKLHLVEAEHEATVVRHEMESTYTDRLLVPEEANVGRPGEAWLWQYAHGRTSHELALLDQRRSLLSRLGLPVANEDRQHARRLRRISHADLGHSVHLGSLVSIENDRRIQAAIATARQRIARLASSAEESVTARELEREKLELALYEAEWQVSQEKQREQILRHQIAQLLTGPDSSITRNVSSNVGTKDSSKRGTRKTIESELISWFRARAEHTGKLELAKCRIELLEWKLSGLQPLLKLGYATWQEVAVTTRDLARAQAVALAAREERRVAELEYQRMLAASAADSSERQVAMLAP